MTNKTITLSRELGSDPITHMAGLLELVVNPRSYPMDILHAQIRSTLELVHAALADPVPPAGGEPEGYKYRLKGRVNRAWTYAKDKPEQFTDEFDVVPLYSGDIVTRLPAEVERLGKRVEEEVATAISNELKSEREVLALQSEVESLKKVAKAYIASDGERSLSEHALRAELTKARELLHRAHAADTAGRHGLPYNVSRLMDDIEAFLQANQSAPADKGQGEPKPTGLSQGWNLTRKHDGFVIGHQSRSPDTKAIEQAERGGYLWVPFLVSDQPAPVAVVLPEHRDSDLRSPVYGYARGWNACLDEVARLNGVKS